MSEDVKPKLYYIVDSSQLNNQPSRVYNVEPKWLAGAVEANKVIELEPTLQLMKEMGDALEFYSNKTKLDCGEMASVKLEKYRKFLEGIK